MRYFLFLATLFCCSNLALSQNNFIEDFKKKWENATAYTIEVAELMPEEHYDYQPTKAQKTFKEQLLHMVGNMAWLSSSYLGGEQLDKDLKSTDYSKDEVLSILREGFALAQAAINNMTVEQLGEKVAFFAGPMHKRQILTLMNDHLTHHRGQAIVYLRLKEIKPPRYRGW